MSEFNQCAHLVNAADLQMATDLYDKLLAAGNDPTQYLLNLQNTLQERVSSGLNRVKAPKELQTKGELYDFVHDQKVALDDEWREMVEAMAGMSKPEKERPALWKKWKSVYDTIRSEKISDLSHEDRLELMFEAIDAAHFFNNVLLALDIDARTLFTMYVLKNAHNIQRQENGY